MLFDHYTLTEANDLAPSSTTHRNLLTWCGQCKWGGEVVCDARVARLMETEGLDKTQARQFIIDSDKGSNCATTDGEPNLNPPCIPLDVFCGECKYKNAAFDCTTRVEFMMKEYQLSEDASKSALLEGELCWREGYVVEDDPRANLPGCGEEPVVEEVVGPLDFSSLGGSGSKTYCGYCMYRDSGLTCDEKAVSLSNDNVDMSLEEAKTSIASDCVRQVINFCGNCMYLQSGLTCEEKAVSLSNENGVSLEEAKTSILSDCVEDESSKLSTGAIIGIVVAILALLLLCLAALLMLRARRRRNAEDPNAKDPNGAAGVEKDGAAGVDADLENGRGEEGGTASNVGKPKRDSNVTADSDSERIYDEPGRNFQVGEGEVKVRAKAPLPKSKSIIAKEYVDHLKKKQDDDDGNDAK